MNVVEFVDGRARYSVVTSGPLFATESVKLPSVLAPLTRKVAVWRSSAAFGSTSTKRVAASPLLSVTVAVSLSGEMLVDRVERKETELDTSAGSVIVYSTVDGWWFVIVANSWFVVFSVIDG